MAQKIPIGLVLLFGAMFIMLYYGVAAISSVDKNINTTDMSSELHHAYNITKSGSEIGFTLGSFLPLLIAIIFIIVLVMALFKWAL